MCELIVDLKSLIEISPALVTHYDWNTASQFPISTFFARGCQQKCLSGDWKARGKCCCRPAPGMQRDTVVLSFLEIHGAAVSTLTGFSRRQTNWSCDANLGSI